MVALVETSPFAGEESAVGFLFTDDGQDGHGEFGLREHGEILALREGNEVRPKRHACVPGERRRRMRRHDRLQDEWVLYGERKSFQKCHSRCVPSINRASGVGP